MPGNASGNYGKPLKPSDHHNFWIEGLASVTRKKMGARKNVLLTLIFDLDSGRPDFLTNRSH
jgi:hypothetical protein